MIKGSILKHILIFRIICVIISFATIFILTKHIKIKIFAPIKPIKVGVLHSQTGPLALSEAPVIEATLMAIEEINKNGGVLGIPIESVIADGMSDPTTFAREAERLITQEKVVVVFGCWSSASRKTVKPIFEKYNNILFYPLQYEGLEASSNIIYTGCTPNQQTIPAALWCIKNIGKKILLIGSDYVFPRAINEILKELIPAIGGEIVGEEYILLGNEDVSTLIKKIEKTKPDAIINSINGITNIAFFKELKILSQKTGKEIPALSLSITDQEFNLIGIENIFGHYTFWSYFESIDTEKNKKFIKRFQEGYGKKQLVNDPMEAAYIGVNIWKIVVEEINTVESKKVIEALRKKYISYLAPEGFIGIEQDSTHTKKAIRIAQVNKEGKSEVLWKSLNPIVPEPFINESLLFKYIPNKRSKEQWEQYLEHLYKSWGNKWSA